MDFAKSRYFCGTLPLIASLFSAAAHGVLQVGDRAGAPHVGFAAHAVGVLAADFERVVEHRHVAEGCLWRSTVSRAISRRPTPSTCVCVPVKYLFDERRAQADGVEDLRAAIRLIGRDAHLGHDLQHGLADGLDVALLDVFLRSALPGSSGSICVERLEREIGVDRFGAIAGERAELMHLVRFAGFDDEADGGAQALLDQVMMHGARSRAATGSGCDRGRPRGPTG